VSFRPEILFLMTTLSQYWVVYIKVSVKDVPIWH